MEVLEAVGSLNAFLCGLHGPTNNVGKTMNALVPFPVEIGSFEDADLLDLNVSVRADGEGAATVEAWGRYATGARVSQIRDFYLHELTKVGARIDVPAPNQVSSSTVVSATLHDEQNTRLRVVVDSSGGYRSVKLMVSYAGFDHRSLFATFADWHRGNAPVSSEIVPTGVEISTFAVGRRPNTLVLYSTNYDCPEQSPDQARAMVDMRFDELGWTYREPREGVMFIQDGQFDAETHVVGDDTSSNVTFVGEFQLR